MVSGYAWSAPTRTNTDRDFNITSSQNTWLALVTCVSFVKKCVQPKMPFAYTGPDIINMMQPNIFKTWNIMIFRIFGFRVEC